MDPVRDQYGRRLDYLRLSVTDRCNLRCRYCMPETGLNLADSHHVLTWDEMLRLCRIFCDLGVRKVRLTGGEPLVRAGLAEFAAALRDLPDPPGVYLTTNGSLLEGQLAALQRAGIDRLNISLDSLQPDTFARITRRRDFDSVWRAIEAADAAGFELKLNMVVLGGLNDGEILDFVALTRERSWTVRLIEAMPFDGQGGRPETRLSGDEILRRIRAEYPLEPVPDGQPGVDTRFQVPGFRGQVGIIYAHSRSFCGSCSRLRVSARGELRTCLYGAPALNLRELLRGGAGDGDLVAAVRGVVGRRARDGVEAQAIVGQDCQSSMAEIGG